MKRILKGILSCEQYRILGTCYPVRSVVFNSGAQYVSNVGRSQSAFAGSILEPSSDDVDQRSEGREVTRLGGQDNSSWLHKVLYNSYLQKNQPHTTFRRKLMERALQPELEAQELMQKTCSYLPISARLVDESLDSRVKTDERVGLKILRVNNAEEEEGSVRYPYKVVSKTEMKDDSEDEGIDSGPKYKNEAENLMKHGIDIEQLLINQMEESKEDQDQLLSLENQWTGTPDPNVYKSDVPCGGCGAYLQCQETSQPGYMPSEKFKIRNRVELRAELCLRCSSLRSYNTALSVNIAPEEYPQVLRKIDKRYAMVILMVDLTDFPCSIWPGIADIIGRKRPVFLVGNKVDLIPRDSDKYLNHIQNCLLKAVQDCGVNSTNIIHTALISAATGFGVEDLITKIYSDWGNRGDIFIMGCTNVGKSSLFNALIQSDMCKVHVVDRIQRSTVSQWPGTTLNLLKFPVMADDKWRMAQRNNRLKTEREFLKVEKKEREFFLQETQDSNYAILKGHVGRTFASKEIEDSAKKPVPAQDIFRLNANTRFPPHVSKPGDWDPSDPEIQGAWCFDTPGTVNENQILDILTLPELKKTLPTKLIEPRSFYIKKGMTMFVGGFARVDFVDGIMAIRYTVFTSDLIPITIVLTEDADQVYEGAFGSAVFAVPSGNEDRLMDFPKLRSSNFELTGMGQDCSCCDIVLSSAGWVAVTVTRGHYCKLTVHSPQGKGIFLREPALLPYAVNLKGTRIRDTPAYLPHRVYLPNYKRKPKSSPSPDLNSL